METRSPAGKLDAAPPLGATTPHASRSKNALAEIMLVGNAGDALENERRELRICRRAVEEATGLVLELEAQRGAGEVVA